jgi:hypothetical protein
MATASASPKVNHIGLPILDYRGGKSTLCAGCGHNAISERIVDALFEMGVEPDRVMKMSGIGCSSKTPAYFLSRSHAFNGVHGRMPATASGAILANHTMTTIGVSGDGDTASIGMGQFVHLMRRNLPMIYIIEDNGVYGSPRASSRPPPTSAPSSRPAWSTICPPSTPARWPSSWAPPSWDGRFPATRSSCSPCSRPPSPTRAR